MLVGVTNLPPPSPFYLDYVSLCQAMAASIQAKCLSENSETLIELIVNKKDVLGYQIFCVHI